MTQLWQDAALRARGGTLSSTARQTSRAIKELEDFIASADGEDAMELLAATRLRIIFHETRRSQEDLRSVYALTHQGLGYFRVPYALDADTHTDSTPQSITATAAIIAVQNNKRIDFEKFVPWLREQLDMIANGVPDL